MIAKKDFPTLAVISATSGVMFTKDFAEVVEVLDFVLDSEVYTHQMPQASKVAKPYILIDHPELYPVIINAKKLIPEKDENFIDNMTTVCRVLEFIYGKTLTLSSVEEAKAVWEPQSDPLMSFLSEKF